MNRLVWKLLRQHISVGQLTGFFLANLFGMNDCTVEHTILSRCAPYFHAGRQLYEKRIYHRYQKNQYPSAALPEKATLSPQKILRK